MNPLLVIALHLILVVLLMVVAAMALPLPAWQNPWTREFDQYTGQFIELPQRYRRTVAPAWAAVLTAAYITWRWIRADIRSGTDRHRV